MEIHFKGALQKDEFFQVIRLGNHRVGKTPPVDLWQLLVVSGGIAVLGSGAILIIDDPLMMSGSMACLGAGLVMLSIGIFLAWAAGKAWDNNEAARAEREGTIGDEQVELRNRFGEARYKWSDFEGYGRYRDVLLLSLGHEVIVLTRGFFSSDADWEQAQEGVKARLPVSHEVKGYSLAGWIPRWTPWWVPREIAYQSVVVYLLIVTAIVIILTTLIKPSP